MGTKVHMIKSQGALWPTPESEGRFAELKGNDIYTVEIKKGRNLQHHRKFYALLQLCYANQDRYDDLESMTAAVKYYLGHAKAIEGSDGKVYIIPKSISFAKMDQTEFEKFYDRAVNFLIKHIMPTCKTSEGKTIELSKEDLEREVRSFLGGVS